MNEICLSCKKHTKCGRAIHETIGCSCYTPMTNEEYIRTCSTEELTEWIVKIAFGKEFKTHIRKIGYANMHSYKTEVLEWLKEKHK